jgi:hypothetical protein
VRDFDALGLADFLDIHLSPSMADHLENMAIRGSNLEYSVLFSQDLGWVLNLHTGAGHVDHGLDSPRKVNVKAGTCSLGTPFRRRAQYIFSLMHLLLMLDAFWQPRPTWNCRVGHGAKTAL